jgi:hypothetical protein
VKKPKPEPSRAERRRRRRSAALAQGLAADAFSAVYSPRGCSVCGQSPVVAATGMCGPCTFGEAGTAGGDW